MRAFLLALVLASPVQAEAPRVLADIPPAASLLAQVMEGVGAPELIADAESGIGHHGALRPSDSRRLAAADVVFWIGPEFSPWLETPIARIAEDATVVRLSEVEGLIERSFREVAVFGTEDHDEEGHDGHDDHDAGAEGHEAHDDHAHDDHAHGDDDPHYWLDPVNAAVWVGAMAATLAEVDPENADRYTENAEAAVSRLEALAETVAGRLDGTAPRFVVAHDALHHFEDRFGVQAVAALSDSHAATPGPRRVAEVREAVREAGAACLLVEAGEAQRTPIEGIPVIEIDPLGLTLAPGAGLYDALITALADAIAGCGGS